MGPVKNIFRGTPLGLVEGPHLHKRNGWYYLTTAEGGTAYNHAVTMARSRKIEGPYELHPLVHPITSKDAPEAPLQRAGHGQIVETPEGLTYHTHLCGRPLPGTRMSPLGRETAIQKCVWKNDDWLYLEDGGNVPFVEVKSPDNAIMPKPHAEIRRDFSKHRELPMEFQWLRTPHPERLFTLTGSALRLHGRESIGSWFEQSLVARRQEDFAFRAETVRRFPARHLPAGRGPHLLLQPLQVPLRRRDVARDDGPRPHDDELPGRLSRRPHGIPAGRAHRDPGIGAREICRDMSTTRNCSSPTTPARDGRTSGRCSMRA